MRLKRFYLLFLMISSFIRVLSNSDKMLITARILDSKDYQPVVMASITNENTGESVYSDLQGYFSMEAQHGDMLKVSHPFAIPGEFITPDQLEFTMTLKRSFYYLPMLNLSNPDDQWGEFMDENLAHYQKGWNEFYREFINIMKSHPQFPEIDKPFNYHLLFGVDKDGQLSVFKLIDIETQKEVSISIESEIIKSSLKKLVGWKPGQIENIPIRQFFRLVIMNEDISPMIGVM